MYPSRRDEYTRVVERSYKGTKGIFQMIEQEKGTGPGKSIEGYLIFLSGLHEEVQEDNIYDLVSKFGKIKNLHLNLDKKSGYAKGYCLLEYQKFDKAKKVISYLNGKEYLGLTLKGRFTSRLVFQAGSQAHQKDEEELGKGASSEINKQSFDVGVTLLGMCERIWAMVRLYWTIYIDIRL